MSARRASSRDTSVVPFIEELPRLLYCEQLSLRKLAEKADVQPSHLSRVLRRTDSKKASAELVGKVAVALGLPRDYFPEYREAAVIDEVKRNPALRDRLYRRLSDAGRS